MIGFFVDEKLFTTIYSVLEPKKLPDVVFAHS
jgi:hypothetical protein